MTGELLGRVDHFKGEGEGCAAGCRVKGVQVMVRFEVR